MRRRLSSLLIAAALGWGAWWPVHSAELSAAQATQLLQRAADAAAAGDPATAERIWRELLPWVRHQAPTGAAMLPQSLLQLGGIQQDLGQLEQAYASYHEALQHARALRPPRPKLEAVLLNNLADLDADLERFAQARARLEESLRIKVAALGPDHLEVGIGYSNLGDLLRELGDDAAAQMQFERSLAVLTPLANQHPLALAAALNNLARLQQSRGAWAEARRSLERAQALRLLVLRPPHPDQVLGLNNLGMLALNEGNLPGARTALADALAQAHQLPGDSPAIALPLANLARVDADAGDLQTALERLTRAQTVLDQQLGANHPSSLNNLAELLLVRQRLGESLALLPPLRRLLEARFALLTEQAWRLSPRERLLLLRRRDSSWYLADALAQNTPEAAELALALRLSSQGLLQELQRQQRRWQQPFRTSAPSPPPDPQRWLEPAQVAAALPTGAVLIELKRYLNPARIPAQGNTPLPWRYRAYVLRPDRRLTVVELGAATSLEPLIRQAYVATAEQLSDAPQRWNAVTTALLDPLRRATGAAREWFVVPDASLHAMPYQALAPERRIRLLTTGRELLRLQHPAGLRATAPVVAGDPAVQNSLPATASELNGVAHLLGVRPVAGAAFTASQLRTLNNPLILHLASHGTWDSAITSGAPAAAQPPATDPMLRSGIVVSGNPHGRPDGQGEQRFHAADFLTLSLTATELVTLAACSTGLGDLHDSEGLYGLQRGIQVAGARSVLTSLWPVDDQATTDWMLRYYRHLTAGVSRADALVAVQREFRDHPNTAWRDPYFWAGWQLVGDWRPIPGFGPAQASR